MKRLFLGRRLASVAFVTTRARSSLAAKWLLLHRRRFDFEEWRVGRIHKLCPRCSATLGRMGRYFLGSASRGWWSGAVAALALSGGAFASCESGLLGAMQ